MRKKRSTSGQNAQPKGKRPQRPQRPTRRPKSAKPKSSASSNQEGIRLNKYLANTGVCSRREADKLIEAGSVKINGKIVTELGTRVLPGDIVNYGGESIKPEKLVYLLLNKPKNHLSVPNDRENQKHVMQLVGNACKERIVPIGRLDRNTTGVLLFTNDGELTKKLTSARKGVKNIYHVSLSKNISATDLDKIRQGLTLEDGFIKPAEIDYNLSSQSKKEVGIEIHSTKSGIIRRIFEHLDYNVVKLDRVYFAGLTKKNVTRGKWRFLDDKEIALLKMLS